MTSAAMVDSHLSAQEQTQIFQRLEALFLSQEERGTLFDELGNPLSSEVLAAQV